MPDIHIASISCIYGVVEDLFHSRRSAVDGVLVCVFLIHLIILNMVVMKNNYSIC